MRPRDRAAAPDRDSHSIRVGGYELDGAIVRVVQQQEKLLIGQVQAEARKIAIGSATRGTSVRLPVVCGDPAARFSVIADSPPKPTV